MRRKVTLLPLHHGKAPSWLFERMVKFACSVMEIILFEYNPHEFLKRISDPIWFQAFGSAAGFDWHSSGLTTTVCAAIKEASLVLPDLPIAICGGKAKKALETPKEIIFYGEKWGIDVDSLIEKSRLCAKIDNVLLQDGYDLYHHTFIFTKDGSWAVIQQGLNETSRMARRYQWLSSENLDLVADPHTGITCDKTHTVLNLATKESKKAQEAMLDFVRQDPDLMMKDLKKITLSMPERHYISKDDLDMERLKKILTLIHENQPESYVDLIKIYGVGKKTIAALSLVSELIYQSPPSFKDPARFSFAHGGKDGHPYPVNRKVYDETIEFLKSAIEKAKLKDREKLDAMRRLSMF
ncbi:MAG: DUF763 domain-containing protein [Desulfobacterota bacterium]|nr:DUF763 domain-containing protein [Thermodesulfobacteriota bacterium]MDW8001949.1 DUF763 domain-containing protein [Deltaproteobacteria bacterium]